MIVLKRVRSALSGEVKWEKTREMSNNKLALLLQSLTPIT